MTAERSRWIRRAIACRGMTIRRAIGPLVACALVFASPLAGQPGMGEGGSSSVAPADSARDAELDALTAEIAAKLRCLVCRGQSVAESTAPLAREMQALIRQKLEAGETPEEIEAFFLASYGDFILLMPRAEGIGTLVYVIPAAVFLLGLTVIGWRLRSARAARAGATSAGATAAAEARERTPSDLADDDRAWVEAAIRGET